MLRSNCIHIQGGKYEDVRKALQEWIELYSRSLEQGLRFELYSGHQDDHFIQADERLDNMRFSFLVNYLHYAQGLEKKATVNGLVKARNEKWFPSAEEGKWLMLHVPEHDKEHDNVYAITSSNEYLKVDFGGKVTRMVDSRLFVPVQVDISRSEGPEVMFTEGRGQPVPTVRKVSLLEMRALWLSIIGIFALVAARGISHDEESLDERISFIAFAVWGWLFFDYRLLQKGRNYLIVLILAIIIFAFGLLTLDRYSHMDFQLIRTATLLPLFMLVIQRPLRLFFVARMDREPVISKPAPSFADLVYSIFLFAGSLIIPALLVKQFF